MPDIGGGSADEWQAGDLDLAAYLSGIGYDADLVAADRTLAGLHRAHLAAIPFGNAHIMLGRGIAVELPGIQGKLVRRGRSGYRFGLQASNGDVSASWPGRCLNSTGFQKGTNRGIRCDGNTERGLPAAARHRAGI